MDVGSLSSKQMDVGSLSSKQKSTYDVTCGTKNIATNSRNQNLTKVSK